MPFQSPHVSHPPAPFEHPTDFYQKSLQSYMATEVLPSTLEHQEQGKSEVHEDWICSQCKGVNFSRRTDCYKCKNEKTKECLIVPYVKSKGPPSSEHFNPFSKELHLRRENAPQKEVRSLMLRG
mmetsp:Transcript_11862/g.20064  ORF Transcript_11862/g.20064 Transcript_11862/m.20064 type:complete len:124 (-) Transcript_11862:679-1050(-)